MSRALFEQQFGYPPAVTAYAPGRIEFIGNHTDYNGGAVLGAAVDLGIEVSVAPRNDRGVRLVSGAPGQPVEASVDSLTPHSGPDSWANYPLGVLQVLLEEKMPVGGFDFAAVSNVPAGAGMSSSAALELSTLFALAGLQGCEPERDWAAAICRRAENKFVGVPCGILDQGVSAFGQKDHLVHIDCLEEKYTRISIPAGCHFWIFNSNKKHALLDSKYAERHRECLQAFEVLRNYSEAPCLAHITPDRVREHAVELGEEIFRRALHVTEEHRRVAQVTAALDHGDLKRVGELLTASHRSSQQLFENSVPELDLLVDELTRFSAVFGARLTGGGFGGAVMALTDSSFSRQGEIETVTEKFRATFGSDPTVFHTTAGDGASLR